MHPMNQARWPRLCAGMLLAAGLAGAVAYGQPETVQPKPGQPVLKDPIIEAKVDPKTGSIVIPFQGVVRFDPKLGMGNLRTFAVSPDGVVTVRTETNNPDRLLITGLKEGIVRLSLEDKANRIFEYELLVRKDYEAEKAKLKASFIELNRLIQTAFPTASVIASAEFTPDGGGIPIVQGGPGYIVMLRGYVTSPQDGENIVRLVTGMLPGITNVAGSQGPGAPAPGANAAGAATGSAATQNPYVINAIQIGGVQQVQIDVVIASVDRNELRSRGFDFNVNGTTVQFSSVLSGLLTPAVGGGGTAVFSPDANMQLGLVPAQFFGAMRALRTEGLAKFLAEPRVVTQTGRPAQFRAGGQQAILSPASGINGPGVVLQPFGTELDVLPIVYGNGKIWLEINPRVTAVNQGLGITTVFGATPGFTEQSARCAVMLESGQTFAIGGLIQNSVQASSSRIPVLGDLPFVGTAFSRVNHEERESELVILVTPRLVHAMDCNQVPRRLPGRETRTPDDYELFLEGILEAPRGQRKVWNGRCYNAAYKCDPSLATMPCAGNVCTGPNAGGNCNANGCAVPSHAVAAGRPAAFPVPSPIPQTLPVNAEPMPAALPPVPVNVPAPEPEVSLPAVPAPQPPAAPATPVAPPAEESPDAPPK